tara:strand:+ start:253 stop:879 length:627 start_codon:yes stop_codon:yes gene_type:complete
MAALSGNTDTNNTEIIYGTQKMSYPYGGYVLCINQICEDNQIRGKYEKNVKNLFSTNHKANRHKDSGFDIFTPGESGGGQPIKIEAGETKLVGLGIKCALYEINPTPREFQTSMAPVYVPRPYYLYPRSSISKRGLMLANSVGIIDSGYRGELKAAFHNTSSEAVIINPGDRLVQICMPNLSTDYVARMVDKLDETKRGEGGIGSTGN